MSHKRFAIKGNTNLNIILKEDSKALEEVVVIGYGTARKSDVTGSIASVGVINCKKCLLRILRTPYKIV